MNKFDQMSESDFLSWFARQYRALVGRLVRRFYPYVEFEDVLQESSLAMLIAFRRGTIREAEPYARKVIRNVVAQFLEKRFYRGRQTGEPVEELIDLPDRAASAEERLTNRTRTQLARKFVDRESAILACGTRKERLGVALIAQSFCDGKPPRKPSNAWRCARSTTLYKLINRVRSVGVMRTLLACVVLVLVGSCYGGHRKTKAAPAEAATYVENFGAVADGYTDNSAALNSAFAYAVAHQGTRLMFACTAAQKYCTYVVKSPITFPTKTTIESMHSTASILYAPSAQPAAIPQAAFQITGGGYTTVKNIGLKTSSNYPPRTILFLARQNGVAGNNIFDSVIIQGYATIAAVYSISSEVNTWHKLHLELDGGGALYGFYTSGADDLHVCAPACGQSSNLSLNMTDYQVLGYVGAAVPFIAIADALGGGTGDHYYRNGYIALNHNLKSIGVELISGNSSQGGPNTVFHLSDTRTENGGYGLYFKKNVQSVLHHINIEGYTFDSNEGGTGEYFAYGDGGLTLAECHMRGNVGEANGPTASMSLDALVSSQLSENYGPITVRTAASGNVLMGAGNTVFHLPTANNTIITSANP
jgi:DNA-directed RNA polymerase specialized sigma24 family protein